MVDKQAKTSLSLEPTSFKIPFSNFKPSINKYILEEWQTSWNNSFGNKLLDIKPTIGEYQSVVRNIRREEVVLARLRLGHTRVTHSYLLQGEEQPQCVGCDAPFTVRHFLLECGDFAQVRNNCFHVDNMKALFQDIHIDIIALKASGRDCTNNNELLHKIGVLQRYAMQLFVFTSEFLQAIRWRSKYNGCTQRI